MNLRADKSSVVSSLPTREFFRAFPFYFVWNAQDVILEVGPSLPKLCPLAVPGARLQDVFFSTRPEGEFSHLLACKHRGQLFLLDDLRDHRGLRGQVIILEDMNLGVMLSSPG